MRRAIYPGSFDPVTFGHQDIIERSSAIFDELIVGVLNNSAKNSLFSLDERVSMLRELTKDIPNVKVDSFDGLLVDYMKSKHAMYIIRGLRAVSDFEYEFQMAFANRSINNDVETIFMVPGSRYLFLSSTIVRDIAYNKGDVSKLVPEIVCKKLQEKYSS